MLYPVLSKPLPNRVTLELTNNCNRSCPGCPRHKMTYPQGCMSEELYTKILGQLPQKTVIVPFFRGESLLHPQFANMMKKLKGFGTVQLATNGDLLNNKNTDAIVKSCSFASLSLHSFMKDNADYLSFLRAAKHEDVTTQISILENLIPQGQKQPFIESWLRYVDRVRIYQEHSHNGFGDSQQPNSLDPNLPCHKPFTDMVVYWDGKVALCNHDWNNTEPLGDLNTQSIEEVWHGLTYSAVRDYNLEGQRSQIRSCQHCQQWTSTYLPNRIIGELYTN